MKLSGLIAGSVALFADAFDMLGRCVGLWLQSLRRHCEVLRIDAFVFRRFLSCSD
jgi:hypothetical protein